MEYLFLLLGAISGSIVVSILHISKRASGFLRIDHSDPEKDIYRLDITDVELDNIHKKKKILLYIDHNADLSQK